MANPTNQNDPTQDSSTDRNPLRSVDSPSNSDSVDNSDRPTDLAASLRVFSESMLRMELAELKKMMASEAHRIEAENRRLETEAELTQTILQTQLQIAEFLSQSIGDRKRKRLDEDDSSISLREEAVLLSLLQFNLLL